MSKIPPAPPRSATSPTDLKAIVKRWQSAKRAATDAAATEMTLRKHLVALLFPKPKEGMNRITKPGLEATCVHKIYRKVDKAAYSTTVAELRKKGLNVDVLVEMEPSLVLKAYRELDPRKRQLFDSVLTITDGSPSLNVNLGE